MWTIILNSVLNTLKRPYRLTFHEPIVSESSGQWSGVFGDLIHNRSDICGDHHTINYERHQLMDNSPILFYSNAISILSGKIYDHSYKGFNVFDSFSVELWAIYGSLLLLVAIVTEWLRLDSLFLLTSLLKVGDNYFALLMQLLSQPQKYFRRICCIKHMTMKTTTLVSITMMTIFFKSKISSDLINKPLLHIDSIDDLAQYILKYPDVEIISDSRSSPWYLFMEWRGHQAEVIKKKLKNVPRHEYNYEDVYNGKTLIIGHDYIFQRVLDVNPQLKFHISRDRHYGSQLGLLYSKTIDKDLKYKVDSVCRALFEGGIITSFIASRKLSPVLNIKEFDNLYESISIDCFKSFMTLLIWLSISSISILIIELITRKIGFVRLIIIILSFYFRK